MATLEQSVALLRKNKRAQVEALNAMGFNLDPETAKASDFPKYMRWGCGILDITAAARSKADGTDYYFEKEKLQELRDKGEYENYNYRGVRVRAYGMSFVVAALPGATPSNTTILNSTGLYNRNFGPALTTNQISGHLTDFEYNEDGTYTTIETYTDCRKETEAWDALYGNDETTAPHVALTYEAYRKDGEDMAKSRWSLPTYAQMMVIYKCKQEINDLIAVMLNSTYFLPIVTGVWTCCKASLKNNNTNVLDFNIFTGVPTNASGPTGNNTGRIILPVSPV